MSLFESLDALEALNNTPKKEEKLVVKPVNKGDLTDEQYSIVHSDDQVIKVKAYAGTGKTFTLKKYAERRNNKKGLYLAFNKELQVEANDLMAEYEKRARDAGLTDIKVVIEMGNPKTLLAKTIPDKEKVDLILVGATGLNAFERLLVGSSSEYILRHTSVDLLVVRDKDKTL